MAAARTIRCLKCPALIPAKQNQHVGCCAKCRAAPKKRRTRDAKDDHAEDPFYLACCDCPALFAYGGGVPKSRCPECDRRHREANPPKPARVRLYDPTGGRAELHAARGGALSAYLRTRRG